MKKAARWLGIVIVIVMGLATAYVLSIGLFVFLWNVFPLADDGPLFEAIVAFYAPLIEAADDRNSYFGRVLLWYMNLCDPT